MRSCRPCTSRRSSHVAPTLAPPNAVPIQVRPVTSGRPRRDLWPAPATPMITDLPSRDGSIPAPGASTSCCRRIRRNSPRRRRSARPGARQVLAFERRGIDEAYANCGTRLAIGIEIDADDHVGATGARPARRLGRCRPGQTHDVGTGLDLAVLITATMPVVTPQRVADLVERRSGGSWRERSRQHRIVREGEQPM